MRYILSAVIALGLGLSASAAPSSQLALSVAKRLQFYGIRVDPATLTTQQAAALHMYMMGDRTYPEVRRKARTILTSPDFRD